MSSTLYLSPFIKLSPFQDLNGHFKPGIVVGVGSLDLDDALDAGIGFNPEVVAGVGEDAIDGDGNVAGLQGGGSANILLATGARPSHCPSLKFIAALFPPLYTR